MFHAGDTDPLFKFCSKCAFDVTGRGLARKILAITGVVLMLFCVSPRISVAQPETPEQAHIEDLRRRVTLLDDTNTKIGAMGERINSIAESQKALQSQLDALSNRAWAGMAAVFVMFLERVLRAFGVTVRDKAAEG